MNIGHGKDRAGTDPVNNGDVTLVAWVRVLSVFSSEEYTVIVICEVF